MALDGITIAALVNELKNTLVNGRITKIAQPEKDELLLTIKQSINNGGGSTMRFQKRLTASVNPSLPLLYLNDENKQSPMSAPTFCMVLRKHLNNCRITEINQAGLERVIRIELEHLNEMGDLCRKFLIIELMGKHSKTAPNRITPKKPSTMICAELGRIRRLCLNLYRLSVSVKTVSFF